jgi:hypothetical protein
MIKKPDGTFEMEGMFAEVFFALQVYTHYHYKD